MFFHTVLKKTDIWTGLAWTKSSNLKAVWEREDGYQKESPRSRRWVNSVRFYLSYSFTKERKKDESDFPFSVSTVKESE